ncbi:MAG TPA: hypothetical protein VL921_04635, partial [Candidatus Udaeobacter sp.]|nr:hypothetical protein [Candidatus Udaeobacter sp.]
MSQISGRFKQLYRKGRKVTSLLFIIGYPVLLTALTLGNMGGFVQIQAMPETPIKAIYIIFTIVV